MKLRFLGATRQVTGSCYRLEAGGLRLLIDCGLFQEREFRGRNWDPLPASPETLDALLLTHAHLDHSGLIPKLVRDGFAGRILTTDASKDLAAIILADAGKIQEEDAAYKRKRHKKAGHTPPRPVVPLYTDKDVQATLPLFEAVRYDEVVRLNENVSVTYRDAGHILGSALLEIEVRENGQSRTIVFSGDIGQRDKPIIRDPTPVARADYVIMESTYGGRKHGPSAEVQDQLAEVIEQTVEAGGNIIIPTFAVERAQELIYHLGELRRDKRIPHLMIFLDSPMAVNVTDVFRRHRECLDAEAIEIIESGH
ncbi:MAG: MBL fold metallo-hydrolase, partial [Planctomycetes bacterium]|nr:MBL fold metallo-hydrolase [Planctomycetota bacterium]